MNTTEQDLKFEDDEYSVYCGTCGACGEEGCCAPSRCLMSSSGEYCSYYLGVLKDAYVELKQIYDFQERLIAVNKELRGVWESHSI